MWGSMHDEWKQTFDAIPDMLALIDTNHRIIRVNKAMAICLNMTPEKCVGQPCYRLMHGKDAIPDQCPHSMLLKDESSHVVEVSEIHLNMDLQIAVSPLFDEKGALIGCVHVARDITDSRKIENILKKSERCLHLITNNMMDLITVLDLKGHIEYISPSHCRVLGYEPDELVKQWSLEFVHPDDRKKILQIVRDTMEKGGIITAELRFRHADGRYIWLETFSHQLLDEDLQPKGLVFSSRDVSVRKSIEEKLHGEEARHHQILDNIDDGYYEVDLSGHFTFFNNVLPKFLGYTNDELMTSDFKKTMDDENVKKVYNVFHHVYLTGIPARLVEFESQQKDGTKAFVESSVFLIKDAEGHPIGFRGLVRDITERKKFQDRLHAMAVTDQLTGLFNRRGFITLVEQQLKSADRTKRMGLLAFVDVDGMKNINDMWGHLEGDRALVNTARLLKQAFRDSDIVARIGGDEFAIFALDVTAAMKEVFFSRLQHQMENHNAQGDLFYTISMSLGFTFYEPANPCSLDELMSRADVLMYEDKKRKSL